MEELENNPGSRLAQKTLAFSVTEIVHGEEIAHIVSNVSEILFGNRTIADLTEGEQVVLLKNAPVYSAKEGTSYVDILVESKLASSKREAKTFIESGAITCNGERVDKVAAVVALPETGSNLLLVKRGKRQMCLIKIE